MYNPIIVFENQYDKPIWNQNISTVPLWTIILKNEKVVKKGSIAKIKFLAENAPQEFMQLQSKFELYAGKTKVADGEIIEIIEE